VTGPAEKDADPSAGGSGRLGLSATNNDRRLGDGGSGTAGRAGEEAKTSLR
jgi:hypothetical protein